MTILEVDSSAASREMACVRATETGMSSVTFQVRGPSARPASDKDAGDQLMSVNSAIYTRTIVISCGASPVFAAVLMDCDEKKSGGPN
jgi:hypothetical protein